MARKVQDKPLFIPKHKSKKEKLNVDIASNLLEDLKLYNEFLKTSGHDFKLDEMVETILESVRKDKIFLKWLTTKNKEPRNQELPLETIKKGTSKEKISGAQAQA